MKPMMNKIRIQMHSQLMMLSNAAWKSMEGIGMEPGLGRKGRMNMSRTYWIRPKASPSPISCKGFRQDLSTIVLYRQRQICMGATFQTPTRMGEARVRLLCAAPFVTLLGHFQVWADECIRSRKHTGQAQISRCLYSFNSQKLIFRGTVPLTAGVEHTIIASSH